mmetsp:Transcript_28427/g.65484  ORF Transcript_28427/g.65484 Transcript_28427/m.65484 type:complete len:281 (+) Transcript_28427:951-1793(+)
MAKQKKRGKRDPDAVHPNHRARHSKKWHPFLGAASQPRLGRDEGNGCTLFRAYARENLECSLGDNGVHHCEADTDSVDHRCRVRVHRQPQRRCLLRQRHSAKDDGARHQEKKRKGKLETPYMDILPAGARHHARRRHDGDVKVQGVEQAKYAELVVGIADVEGRDDTECLRPIQENCHGACPKHLRSVVEEDGANHEGHDHSGGEEALGYAVAFAGHALLDVVAVVPSLAFTAAGASEAFGARVQRPPRARKRRHTGDKQLTFVVGGHRGHRFPAVAAVR